MLFEAFSGIFLMSIMVSINLIFVELHQCRSRVKLNPRLSRTGWLDLTFDWRWFGNGNWNLSRVRAITHLLIPKHTAGSLTSSNNQCCQIGGDEQHTLLNRPAHKTPGWWFIAVLRKVCIPQSYNASPLKIRLKHTILITLYSDQIKLKHFRYILWPVLHLTCDWHAPVVIPSLCDTFRHWPSCLGDWQMIQLYGTKPFLLNCSHSACCFGNKGWEGTQHSWHKCCTCITLSTTRSNTILKSDRSHNIWKSLHIMLISSR